MEGMSTKYLYFKKVQLSVIINWARTLKEPFAASSHPDLLEVVKYIWGEEFPKIPADDTVHAVVCQKVKYQ